MLGMLLSLRYCDNVAVTEPEDDTLDVVVVDDHLRRVGSVIRREARNDYTIYAHPSEHGDEKMPVRRATNMSPVEVAAWGTRCARDLKLSAEKLLLPCKPTISAGVYRVPDYFRGLLGSLHAMSSRKVWMKQAIAAWSQHMTKLNMGTEAQLHMCPPNGFLALLNSYNKHVHAVICFANEPMISHMFRRYKRRHK
jgi:hypothetical protein